MMNMFMNITTLTLTDTLSCVGPWKTKKKEKKRREDRTRGDGWKRGRGQYRAKL